METNILTEKNNFKTKKLLVKPPPKYEGKEMSLEDYLNWEHRIGEVAYEWFYGKLEAKYLNMRNNVLYIVSNLLDKLKKTNEYKQVGEFFAQYQCRLDENQIRIPDLCFLTKQQILSGAKNENPIPEFVIEIISKNDQVNKIENKVLEYFRSGVKLVWHIFPKFKMVRIFHSLKNINNYTDNDICSASPVLNDFEISVNELFNTEK